MRLIIKLLLFILAAQVSSEYVGGVNSLGITEEEALRFDTPEYLKCDSCIAVAYEISFGFLRFERHLTRLMTDTEIINIMDSVCKPTTFSEYGVTAENRKRLVGPAFWRDNPSGPTRVLSSGRFPVRLAETCSAFSDWDDDTINDVSLYERWVKFGRSTDPLINVLCLNPMAADTAHCIGDDQEVKIGSSYYRQMFE